MMDETSTPAPQTPNPPVRPWHRKALLILVPVFAALTLYTALPQTSRAIGSAAGSGCDHTPAANGVSACPHGVDANGGCNMNAAAAPDRVPVRPEKALDWTIPEGVPRGPSEFAGTVASPRPGTFGTRLRQEGRSMIHASITQPVPVVEGQIHVRSQK